MSAQRQPFEMPKYLYHGTSASALPSILEHGILPRGGGKVNNWAHTIGSNKRNVYLTSTYGLYFAASARKEGDECAILELDVSMLLPRLCADEDALEQGLRGHDKLPADWDMKRRTIYYRSRAHLYAPEGSLQALGTCSHRGRIAPDAITRIVRMDLATEMRLTFTVSDPIVMILNHRILGERNQEFMRWLFGHQPVLIAYDREISREGIRLLQRNEKGEWQ